MNSQTSCRIAIFLLSVTLIGCSSNPATDSTALQRKPLVVFLVRHGEKIDRSVDAELSTAGHERAAELAKTLRSAEIEYVHSSDFVRTKSTATPTAQDHELEVEVYDHRDLSALAEKLQRTGGRHLVVGHSTTTPAMVELLGGKPHSPINEEGEFDRIYVIMIGKDGTANSALIRYGNEYTPRAND